ncbi:MAG: factor for cell wall maintenance or synthesis YoaR [Clostridiales bacterium]|nr:factor for cell wall maintenance or synthesis YoaR [Clostridiales bacterium]
MKKIILTITLLCTLTACNNQNNNQNNNQINYEQQQTPITSNIIGTYSTKLTDKAEGRVHNIKLAISKLDGTKVEPGETFSFNETIGPREEKDGYKEAIIFDGHGNKTKGFGGGVCQVTSTLYNAVRGAGLEIEERHQHSREVPYVNEGDDATVSFYGNEDLKFKNTKEYTITIKAEATEDKVTIIIEK